MEERLSVEDQRLLALFQREWENNLHKSPEMATFIGDHRFNDRLSDLSEAAHQADFLHTKELLVELDTFSLEQLNQSNQLNYQLYRLKIENAVQEHQFKGYLMPINQMHGIQNFFNRLVAMMPFAKEIDFQNYLSRLKAFPLYIEQTIELMNSGITEGLTVPAITMADVPAQIYRQLPEDYQKSDYYKPIASEHKKLSSSLRAEIEAAIKENLYPAFLRLAKYLEDTYIPSCRETIGLGELPRGGEYYDLLLHEFTTTNLTAREIHEIGLKEVERIFAEIQEVMKTAGFSDYEQFLNFLRTDERFYFKDEDSLLLAYRDFAKRIDKELPRFFRLLPRLPFAIEKVPDHQAPSSPTAFYMSPDLKMTRAGIYYANTSQLETRPKYELESLTLHEAVPGHHLQICLALELGEVPEFRKSARFTGYVEGWALYAEKLGAEMGFYADPFMKFGQLSFEIWRACRLVIDTGLHVFGWSRKKAIDYLKYYTGKSEAASTVEVDRYLVMPGQATAYKIGELKILELRAKAEETLGDNFDLREFHDVILRNGAIPLNVLEDYVEKYLLEKTAK